MTRLLLVDDEPNLRAVMALLLERMGYTVTAVGSLDAALRALPVDIALLDVMMPDHDGFAVAAQLRAAQPALPLVFCTGFPSARVRRRAAEIGAHAVLEKPMMPDELTEALDGALSRRVRHRDGG